MNIEDFDILIACECSGMVRDAFIAAGHRAISCDLKPTQRLGPHYHGDVNDILHLQHWKLLIAHPVCRYLTNAGSKHLYRRIDGVWSIDNGRDEERWANMREGAEFFKLFEDADHIPMRAVENPIMHRHAVEIIGRRADQYVQPWMFGDPFTKATGLHLTGLPKLVPQYTKEECVTLFGPIVAKCHMMQPGPDREEKRSETEPGLAHAFATQWGPLVEL